MSGNDNDIVVGIDEIRGKTQVRWKVGHRGKVIADVKVKLPADTDTLGEAEVRQAIADHFVVGTDRVHFHYGPHPSALRYLPTKAIIKMPRTCEHTFTEEGCDLVTCEGTPGMDTPLEFRRVDLDDDGPEQTGFITEAREVLERVARDTGTAVGGGFVGDNGWVEKGIRQVEGYGFVADGWPVRVLIFEGRESRMVPTARYTAVYVGFAGGELVLRDQYARQGRVVTAIVEHLDMLVDDRTMDAHDGGWVWLKHPQVGWQVLTEEHGLVTITEASSNNGFTLRVTDADGVFRFVDRPGPKRWYTAPAGTAMPDGEGVHEVAAVTRTEVAGVPVETIQAQTLVPDVTHVEVDGVVVAETTRVDLTSAAEPVADAGPVVDPQVRQMIAAARWSIGRGTIRKRHKFTGPMMHPALPDRRLSAEEWKALAEQVSKLGGGAWMPDVKAFACESGDVGNPWRAATPSTHERVDAWLAATAAPVEPEQAEPGVVEPAPGQVATVQGWSGATVFVADVADGHVVGVESGGTVARVPVDMVTAVEDLAPDDVAATARAHLAEREQPDDVRPGLEALAASGPEQVDAVIVDPADWAGVFEQQGV